MPRPRAKLGRSIFAAPFGGRRRNRSGTTEFRARRLGFERLEDRRLLTITDSFVAGSLVFTGDAADDVLTLNVNNAAGTSVQYDLGAGTVVRSGVVDIAFTGGGGADTFNLVGSSADDEVAATIGTPDSLTWGSVPITATAIQNLSIDTGGGNDRIRADLAAAAITTAVVGPGSTSIVYAAKTFTTTGNESFIADVGTIANLTMNDTTGNDTFYYQQGPALSTAVAMIGGGYSNHVRGSLATQTTLRSLAGGTDTAVIADSTADDKLTATATYATLIGGGRRVDALQFERTYTSAINGGNDTAVLVDAATDDRFYRNSTYVNLSGPAFFNQAAGFEKVYAYANNGGNDLATYFGSAADETLYGRPEYAVLVGASRFEQATGFDSVSVTSGGGTDRAIFNDGAGDDTFTSRPDSATLGGAGYSVRVDDYRFVYAIASAGNDTALMYDSAGNDHFLATPTTSVLQGTGFFTQELNFERVTGQASAGFDLATLYDSAGNDTLLAAGNEATLTTPTVTLTALNFDGVAAVRSTGTDIELVTSPNFAYGSYGGWTASSLVEQLTTPEVQQLLRRGAAASASNDAIIAVVDRNGNILGVRTESGINTANTDYLVFAIDGAVAKARTAAFFSSNAAPLPSRTVRFISQSTILQREVESNPNITDTSSTERGPGFVAPIGVGGHFPPEVDFTPLVDLFDIEHTNRDSIKHPGNDGIKGTADDQLLSARFNVNPAFVPAGKELTPPESYGRVSNLRPDAQSRGIATLPGGIPIYKNGTLVGGIGVFFPGPKGYATFEQGFVPGIGQTEAQRTNASRVLESEWIAFAAVGGSSGAGAPVGTLSGVAALPGFDLPSGRIDLVGITLESVGPVAGPTGITTIVNVGNSVGRGSSNSGADQKVNAAGATLVAGKAVPEGWLVNPHNSADGTISALDVQAIVQQGINQANATRAAIRLPLSSRTRMVFTVTDKTGEVLGQFRMSDATYFSIDVATAKARNTAYYNDPAALQPIDQLRLPTVNPTVPLGTAFTARTFRFLAAPRFPTGASSDTLPGVFSALNTVGINRLTAENIGSPLPASAFDATIAGHDSFFPNTNFHDPGEGGAIGKKNQNGIVFFPGSSGLYKNGVLVGGFGVSGDGVDQDDVVTVAGQTGYEPFLAQRIDANLYNFPGAVQVRLPYQKFNRNPQG